MKKILAYVTLLLCLPLLTAVAEEEKAAPKVETKKYENAQVSFEYPAAWTCSAPEERKKQQAANVVDTDDVVFIAVSAPGRMIFAFIIHDDVQAGSFDISVDDYKKSIKPKLLNSVKEVRREKFQGRECWYTSMEIEQQPARGAFSNPQNIKVTEISEEYFIQYTDDKVINMSFSHPKDADTAGLEIIKNSLKLKP